jgi:hypothetical protein
VAKRIILIVIGAGMGALAGLVLSFIGLGNKGLFIGAIVGGLIPPIVLGRPGR